MLNHIRNFTRWLFAFVAWLVSNPRRARLVIALVALVVVTALVMLPSLTSIAAGMAGGGN